MGDVAGVAGGRAGDEEKGNRGMVICEGKDVVFFQAVDVTWNE